MLRTPRAARTPRRNLRRTLWCSKGGGGSEELEGADPVARFLPEAKRPYGVAAASLGSGHKRPGPEEAYSGADIRYHWTMVSVCGR